VKSDANTTLVRTRKSGIRTRKQEQERTYPEMGDERNANGKGIERNETECHTDTIRNETSAQKVGAKRKRAQIMAGTNTAGKRARR
jgi:hypothetical protein